MSKRRKRQHTNQRSGRAEAREHFVLPIYRDIDAVVIGELERLRTSEGVEPSCDKGCFYCCSGAIPVTRPEARGVAQYVKRHFSTAEIGALRARMDARFDWLLRELPQLLSSGMDEASALYEHGPPCPLLDNGLCTVYAARPAICRTHFVSSDPRSCAPRIDPEALAERPVVIESIHVKTTPHVQQIRKHIEAGGDDFWDSVGPLPRLLAVELGWKDGNRAKRRA